MGMGMALIPMGINARMQCLAYVIVMYSLLYNGNSLQYTLQIPVHTHYTIMTEILIETVRFSDKLSTI